MSAPSAARSARMTFSNLQKSRIRDNLLTRLYNAFDNDALEKRSLRKVSKNQILKNVVEKWSDFLHENKINVTISKAGMPQIPPEIEDEIYEEAKNCAETEFIIQNCIEDSALSRGLPHFPSILKRKGPSFPFMPGELSVLMKRAGSLRGHEMGVELNVKGKELHVEHEYDEDAVEKNSCTNRKRNVSPVQKKHDHFDMWSDGIRDDNDLIDARKRPYLT